MTKRFERFITSLQLSAIGLGFVGCILSLIQVVQIAVGG